MLPTELYIYWNAMKTKFFTLYFTKEYFLFLLPLFFALHGFVLHYPLVPFWDAVGIAGTYTLLSFLLTVLFFLFVKSWRKAALISFSISCFQLCFGVLHDGMKSVAPNSFISSYTFFVPFLLLLIISVSTAIIKSKKQFSKAVTYINVLLLLWLLIDGVQLIYKTAQSSATTNVPPSQKALCDTCDTPDIYFIIADEYAGYHALKEVFGFDNSAFENDLRKRGFHVIDSSFSNYNYTPYSVASILNMDYLSGITDQSNLLKNRNISYSTITRNKTTQILTQWGYDIANLSVFDIADKGTPVDNQFFATRKKLITGQTFTQRFRRDIEFNFVTRFKIAPLLKKWVYSTNKINEELYQKTVTETTNQNKKPRFIYTHLFMPHYPYYYRANGTKNTIETFIEGQQHRKREYLEYLQYSNKKFLNLIDVILKNSKQPPVIIFMGDHGFRHFSEPVDQRYHFQNLAAVYLPYKNYGSFYKGMSGVNMFRVIFNSTFQQNLPLLKDSSSFLREY